MVAGELVTEGTPSGIKSRQEGHLIEFVVDQPQSAADLLKQGPERCECLCLATAYMSSRTNLPKPVFKARLRNSRSMASTY